MMLVKKKLVSIDIPSNFFFSFFFYCFQFHCFFYCFDLKFSTRSVPVDIPTSRKEKMLCLRKCKGIS